MVEVENEDEEVEAPCSCSAVCYSVTTPTIDEKTGLLPCFHSHATSLQTACENGNGEGTWRWRWRSGSIFSIGTREEGDGWKLGGLRLLVVVSIANSVSCRMVRGVCVCWDVIGVGKSGEGPGVGRGDDVD